MLSRNGDRRELLEMALSGHEIRLADIQAKIREIEGALRSLWGTSRAQSDEWEAAPKRRPMSIAAKKRIAEAQKKRWAEFRKQRVESDKPSTKTPVKKPAARK